jgi:LysM repeat protein
MRSLWWNMLVQPQICFMCGGGGETTGGGGDDDNNSGSTTTTTTTTGGGRYEDSRSDLEAQGYTVSDDGNSVYSDTGQVAGANWSQGSIDAIVDDDDGGSTTVAASSGDTVSQIALDNNTTIEDIKALNPGIDINNIQVGQEINVTPDSRDEGESIYTGATQAELDAGNVMKVASTEDIMAEYEKLQAAGESDTSPLDESAAADTTGIEVYEPTQETVTAVEDYYTSGPGSPGYTTAVDYTQTSSGEDFVAAAESDTSDIVGGTDFTTYEGETVEVRELPSGTKYYVDMSGNYVALAPEEDVTVDTFSDSEITTPVSEIAGPFDGTQTYEETVLEPGTGGISGIRLGDPMTPQLAAELGLSDIYQEGDVILAEDLIKLDELGFDVSQADLSGIDLKTGADAGTLTITTGDGATATTAVQGSMADMQNYIEQLNQQVGGATFEDLEAAGFDVDLIKQYNDTVGSIPGMPVEGTMLYSSLYGGDGGVYTGDQAATDTTDILDYEDYITQGGQNPLGGGGLPDDFFEQPTSDVINLNGQLYAVGYAEGAIDPGIANEIRRAEMDGYTTPQTLANIAKAATSPIFQSLGMSVEGLARSGDTTVEAVVEAAQDSSNPIEFLNTFATRVGEGARDVIYNITEAVGGEVPETVKTFFGEEGATTVARPEDAEDFEFNLLDTVASNVYEPLYNIEQEIYESIPEDFRNTMEANQLVGSYQDLISGNIRTAEGKTFLEAMKDNPGETSAQLLSNIGDVASDLLVLAITRSPGATALFGFGEGSQDARNTFEDDLKSRVQSGEFANDPNFQALVESEGSVEAATNALYDKFEKYAFGAGGVEAVSDALIYGIGGKLATKVLPNAVTTGAIGAGAAVTGSAVLEGTTEGVQQFVSNVGINDVLAVSDDVGRNVGTAFINALIPGAGAGIVTAATTRFLGPKEMADMIQKAETQTGQDLTQLKNMLTSSDSISVTTDAQGNLQFTNTETNQSITMPTASSVSAGAAAGTETNVSDITAAEILNSGNEIEFTTDNEGNSVLTDKVTGDSVNLGTGSVTSTEDTTKITGATGAVGAAGATGATGAGATTNTLAGNSSVTTSGDVEITTTVDPNGNTTVTTKNTVTGATTSDIVPTGTTSVITNGTTDVTVDATTSTATGVTTTAVDTAITTDVTPTVDTDVATDVTPTVDTTPTVTPTVTPTPETEELPGDEDVVADVVDEDVTADVTADDEPDLTGETAPTYTSGIAGMGGGMRPVVAPYYQPQQTGIYSFYTPQPGVDQVPAQPVFTEQPASYLAPTAQPQYGYGYIAPNADLEYLRRLAEIQGTGAARLPSEDLMDGS